MKTTGMHVATATAVAMGAICLATQVRNVAYGASPDDNARAPIIVTGIRASL